MMFWLIFVSVTLPSFCYPYTIFSCSMFTLMGSLFPGVYSLFDEKFYHQFFPIPQVLFSINFAPLVVSLCTMHTSSHTKVSKIDHHGWQPTFIEMERRDAIYYTKMIEIFSSLSTIKRSCSPGRELGMKFFSCLSPVSFLSLYLTFSSITHGLTRALLLQLSKRCTKIFPGSLSLPIFLALSPTQLSSFPLFSSWAIVQLS